LGERTDAGEGTLSIIIRRRLKGSKNIAEALKSDGITETPTLLTLSIIERKTSPLSVCIQACTVTSILHLARARARLPNNDMAEREAIAHPDNLLLL
jgi:hypothetical protein